MGSGEFKPGKAPFRLLRWRRALQLALIFVPAIVVLYKFHRLPPEAALPSDSLDAGIADDGFPLQRSSRGNSFGKAGRPKLLEQDSAGNDLSQQQQQQGAAAQGSGAVSGDGGAGASPAAVGLTDGSGSLQGGGGSGGEEEFPLLKKDAFPDAASEEPALPNSHIGAAQRRGYKASHPSKKSTTPPPPPPPSPPPPSPPAPLEPEGSLPILLPGCADYIDQCPLWRSVGECVNNPAYMYYNCRRACNVCNVTYLHDVPLTVEVSEGVWMPRVGFGTAGMGEGTREAVLAALQLGYRLVDTAQAREWYRQDLVGAAITASGIPRDQLFVTSKLHPQTHGYWSTLQAAQDIMEELQVKYLDLLMVHYPECWPQLCPNPTEGDWKDSWAALEELLHEGTVRAIGVSNFNLAQLQQLLDVAVVKPAVVQSNSDPLRQDHELQAFCRRYDIVYQGYSTLGTQWVMQTGGRNPVLEHGAVWQLASARGRSPAQVVLRWALQHSQSIIPRSSKPQRMQENLQLFDFDLTDQDMQLLDSLDGSMRQA